MNIITKYRQYCVSLIQLFLFVPFYKQGFIGADWDSYGTYASSFLIFSENMYLPSRSPGFPLFEYLISSLINFQVRGALLVIFIFLVGVNLITHKLFDDNNENDFLYYALLLSPILLISSFSIIDYVVGLFFSLAGIFVAKNLEKPGFLFLVLMLLSSATRLSNAIFFIAGIYILHKRDLGVKKVTLITLLYLFGLLFVYYPAYNLAGGLCFLNLTNTDHLLFHRIGRFIYKQIYLVGLFGFFGLIYVLINNKKNFKIKESNLPYILIFILFEISFMRLPTEEGHMLPSLFMFFLILSQIEISKQVQIYLLISIFLSNFIYFDLIKVDVPNHAKNVEFSPGISRGLLLEDYRERAIKGSKANYHIDNAINQVVNSWSDGGPNC